MKPAILYISYDGMLEPLGQSQVLAYLERLASSYSIHLLSFEKQLDWRDELRRTTVAEQIASAGIQWLPLKYHKAPSAPATLWDIVQGSVAATRLVRRHGIRVVHARSYVAGLMGLSVKRLTGAKLLFDMRGFWADERVDGGIWPEDGRLYRSAKQVEKRLLEAADHIVTLTHASVDEIRRLHANPADQVPISVIPTCADLAKFKPFVRTERDSFTLGHVGSVGTWYLFGEFLNCFKALLKIDSEARILIVNRGEHDLIISKTREAGIAPERLELLSATPDEVPALISRMTAGSAIIKPLYSKMASAPTKLAEYLGCGIPCLGNHGVGDMAAIIERHRVGVALTDFSTEELHKKMSQLVSLAREDGLRERCAETAGRLFSLDFGASSFATIYQELVQDR